MPKSAKWSSKEESKHLPIYQHKRKLIQAVMDSSFLVVTGETGSGKTTQLPQYLHEAGKLGLTVTYATFKTIINELNRLNSVTLVWFPIK